MAYSEGFWLKAATIPIIGIGTIFLGYCGSIPGEAVTAILGALVGFLVGESVVRTAYVAAKTNGSE